jgi:hypothetical protein
VNKRRFTLLCFINVREKNVGEFNVGDLIDNAVPSAVHRKKYVRVAYQNNLVE